VENAMWNFEQFAENVAFVSDDGNQLTYSRLQEEIDKLAASIGRRCLVFSMCSNTIGSVIGYISFMKNRIVPALLNEHLDDELVTKLIASYSPSFIWIPNKHIEKFVHFEKVYECFGYTLLKVKNEIEYMLHDELGLLLTTSGSTGSPKFVRQTYTNVFVNAEQIACYLELDHTERPITTLPMNYTYGLSIFYSHLMVGATILLTDKSMMTREFWTFMKEQKATSFGGVPYTYEMMDKMRFFRMELPELRTMTQAGGKLSPELHKKFALYAIENKKQFVVMYGACEATARMTYLPHERSLEKYGSMGIPIPGGKLTIIDENDQVLEGAEVTGELVYEGPNVTMGYAERGDDLIKGDERNGILRTGDMAKRDEDGFYYIVGRKKRFLKIYGNRVNLDEVDSMIKGKFNFMDCASSGVDDHMYIFVTDESVVDEVRTFIVNKTGLNQTAFKVVLINQIPKNDAGKVLYTELSKYYE